MTVGSLQSRFLLDHRYDFMANNLILEKYTSADLASKILRFLCLPLSGSKMTNSGFNLLVFFPFNIGRKPPKCSKQMVQLEPVASSPCLIEEKMVIWLHFSSNQNKKRPITFEWLINQLSPLTLVTTRVTCTRGLLNYLIMVQQCLKPFDGGLLTNFFRFFFSGI